MTCRDFLSRKQYEEILQGKRTVKEIHLDKHGDMESVENIEEGSKGKKHQTNH